MAYASSGSDPDRHQWCRPGAALGRSSRGDSARRRRVVSARAEALARRVAATAMTHIAIQEKLDGKAVEWLEHVSSAQYES
jgi:hypothetical protein